MGRRYADLHPEGKYQKSARTKKKSEDIKYEKKLKNYSGFGGYRLGLMQNCIDMLHCRCGRVCFGNS